MNTKYIIALVAVVAVAAGAFLYYTPDNEPTDNSAGTTTSSGMRAEENAVVVNEQKPGNTVTGSVVYLSAPGFLVIHETFAGNAGAIIGASAPLPSGENKNVKVNLARASKDGEKLIAMLHNDVDGNGKFDAAIDTPVQSTLGGAISGSFDVSVDAQVNIDVTI